SAPSFSTKSPLRGASGTRCLTSNATRRAAWKTSTRRPSRGPRATSSLPTIFVTDTGLNTLWSGNWIRQNGTQRIVGSFNNAAVGTALGQANGIQALDRASQVIVLTGDGGMTMLLGEYMTAIHHKLPIKVVVFNNSALGLITLEAESIGLTPFRSAIEFL